MALTHVIYIQNLSRDPPGIKQRSDFHVVDIPTLKTFDPGQHIEVSGRILFDDVLDVVRSKGFLELPPGHEELDLPQRTNGSFVNIGQLGHSLPFFQIICGNVSTVSFIQTYSPIIHGHNGPQDV